MRRTILLSILLFGIIAAIEAKKSDEFKAAKAEFKAAKSALKAAKKG